MGIFDRISRVIKANINDLIDKAEDPEKMLNQLIEEMDEDLNEVKSAVASAIATLKQLEGKQRENQEQADKWQAKAELAVTKGEDDLAREALTRKKSFQSAADGFKTQAEEQRTRVEALKANLEGLEKKIVEARTKKDVLVARHRSAEADERIQKTLGKASNNAALSAFERMEQKVNENEAKAAAYAELNTDNLEKKFEALEADNGVDDELAALKAKLGK